MLTIKNGSSQFFSFACADFESLRKNLCVNFLGQKNVQNPKSRNFGHIVLQLAELHPRSQWHRFVVFIVNFEHISQLSSIVSIVNFEHVYNCWLRYYTHIVLLNEAHVAHVCSYFQIKIDPLAKRWL